MTRNRAILISLLILTFVNSGTLFAQANTPRTQSKWHRQGNLWIVVTNFGQFGDQSIFPASVFPGTPNENAQIQNFNRGGLVIGAVVDGDSLVSEGTRMWSTWDFLEMFPGFSANDTILEGSQLTNKYSYSEDAISEQDFISTFTDTFDFGSKYPWMESTQHKPMGIKITQRSYQWSFSYSEDFIIFDFVVENIGNKKLKNLYAAYFVDADVRPGLGAGGQDDDVSGFMHLNLFGDTVNVAWSTDDDGENGEIHAMGVRVLRPDPKTLSFNWWQTASSSSDPLDWGPFNPDNPNDFAGGSPVNDKQKYKLMSNGEFDPNQRDDAGILLGPVGAVNDKTRFLLSFGPFGTDDPDGGPNDKVFLPGDSLNFTIAVIGGEGQEGQLPYVSTSRAMLDLGNNAVWTQRMFDNPGVDTDGDGYRGEDFDGDGVFDTGDGVPDFAGPPPPPSPTLTVKPEDHQIVLEWDLVSELFEDPFISDDPATPDVNERMDFEGYRVWRSESGTIGSFNLIVEFDVPHNLFGWNFGLPRSPGETVNRYVDKNLPNGKFFYYSVTSFDRGDTLLGLEPLESNVLNNLTRAAASPVSTTGFAENPVAVEPNPYIGGAAWEPGNLLDPNLIEYNRRIDFVNLPSECTIRIYTIDGDFVQLLEHDDPFSSRKSWDMLSRNIQAIASGIYLFTVETPTGDRQVGKFIVVK